MKERNKLFLRSKLQTNSKSKTAIADFSEVSWYFY